MSGGGGNRTILSDSASGLAVNHFGCSVVAASANGLHLCDPVRRSRSLDDIALIRIIQNWPSLPEHIKLAVLTLITSTSTSDRVV